MKNICTYKKKTYLCIAINNCPDGGIGRRAGLKHQWGNPSRFDPGSGYKKQESIPAFLFLNIFRIDVLKETDNLAT